MKVVFQYHPGGTMDFKVKSQSMEVDDFLRALNGYFVASNGWTIASFKKPEIDIENKIVYIRGSETTKDLRVDVNVNVPEGLFKGIEKGVNEALKELTKKANDFKSKTRFIGLIGTGYAVVTRSKPKFSKPTDMYFKPTGSKIRQTFEYMYL